MKNSTFSESIQSPSVHEPSPFGFVSEYLLVAQMFDRLAGFSFPWVIISLWTGPQGILQLEDKWVGLRKL